MMSEQFNPKTTKPSQTFDMSSLQRSIGRAEFIERLTLMRNTSHLEVGPLNRPLLRGSNVKYFDLVSTFGLREKASNEGLDPTTIPNIDYYHQDGDLSVVKEQFDCVVSAHVIEHQPDLIRHLQQVSEILKIESAKYFLVIPDKRYCFDALIPETKIVEVIEAFENKQTKPSIYKVIEHRALTTHNDPVEHWVGNHGLPNINLKSRWEAARQEFERSNGSYIDVHCWQFTPQSFASLINGLFELGYIDFVVDEIFDTPRNDLEFCAVLRKC
jgi:hypothetical protein